MRLSSHTPSAASGGCARKARGVGNARHERRRHMKYRKKPVVIEAITFGELVDYGRVVAPENAAEHGGYAWHFSYKGHPLTHENDDCYLIPTLEGTMRFERGDIPIGRAACRERVCQDV